MQYVARNSIPLAMHSIVCSIIPGCMGSSGGSNRRRSIRQCNLHKYFNVELGQKMP
jgi:hypothetical protein